MEFGLTFRATVGAFPSRAAARSGGHESKITNHLDMDCMRKG